MAYGDRVQRWFTDLGKWSRRAVAAGAGICTALAFQPFGLWPLLFLGVPLLTVCVLTASTPAAPPPGGRVRRLLHRSRGRGFGVGFSYGVGFTLVALQWVRVIVWVLPVPLALFEALFFALLGGGIKIVRRLPVWPVWAAASWVAMEFAYSNFPFGGFGWLRLAYATVDTPLSGYLPLIGVSGVTFVTALIGQLVAWAVVTPAAGRRRVVAVALALGIGILGFAGSAYRPAATDRLVTVGLVQGNVDGAGIEFLGRARSVTNNHLSETVTLVAKARTGAVPEPDFVVWPENSTDIDPLRDPITKRVVQTAVDTAGKPILVGAVTEGPGPDQRRTVGIWWDQELGPTAAHYKRNLVPFGEYVPFRSILRPLFPILERVGRDSVPGTDPGVLSVRLPDGTPLKVGDAICFELASDRTMHGIVRNGAEVTVVQSNNATYRGTGQPEQQFAITRARAMESRREIVVATTNSLSGYIEADGSVTLITKEGTSASAAFSMPIRTAITPAIAFGAWLELAVSVLAMGAVVFTLVAGRVGRLR